MNAAVEPPIERNAFTRRRGLAMLAAAMAMTSAFGALAVQAEPGVIVRPWPGQRAVPPFDLSDLEGRRWNLAALRGKLVVLNFWASWCEPCRAEMPSLERLARRLDGQAVVLAVNYRESESAIRRFTRAMPLELPILRDADGAAARAWTPRIFPSTVIIGRDGRPLFTVLGEADWSGEAARAWLAPHLGANAEPPAGTGQPSR